MGSAASLINNIISISLLDPRIEAVVLTGSRGREQGVDDYSDIDIELIGHGVTELFHDKDWISLIDQPLFALHLLNGGEDEPESPTCLVLYEEGRKVDFTFAEPERLHKMKRQGLDATFSRGFMVLLDKTGLTDDLPTEPNLALLLPKRLSEAQFKTIISDFWLEAHQVSIALARNELWVAWSRSADIKQYFLSFLEQLVSIKSMEKQDVWYKGRNYQQWMPEQFSAQLVTIFDCSTAHKAALSLDCLITCFIEVITELAALLGYDCQPIASAKMQILVRGILKDNSLIAKDL